MAHNLLKKKCVPCEKKGIKPFTEEEAREYLAEVADWQVNDKYTQISKEYKFQDFIGAINFVNRIADIAEMEGHHPDLHIFYNKVRVELWTHSIDGLSENDFIVATRIDAECNW